MRGLSGGGDPRFEQDLVEGGTYGVREGGGWELWTGDYLKRKGKGERGKQERAQHEKEN